VELKQFPQGHAFDGSETLAAVIVEKLLRLLRGEALNHTWRILRYTLYVKRFPELNLTRSPVPGNRPGIQQIGPEIVPPGAPLPFEQSANTYQL
jgi:hypothetical protein